MTNTSLLRKSVIYGLKKFYNIGLPVHHHEDADDDAEEVRIVAHFNFEGSRTKI